MVKELVKETRGMVEYKEEQKLMNAIHNQAKEANMHTKLNTQLDKGMEYVKGKRQENLIETLKKTNITLIVMFALALIVSILIIATK